MPYTPSESHPMQTTYHLTISGGDEPYAGVVSGYADIAVLGEFITEPGTPEGAVTHADAAVQAIIDAISSIPGFTASAYKTAYETQYATVTPAP